MNLLRKMQSSINGATVSCLLFFILYYLYLWQVVDLRLVYHNGGGVCDFPVFYTGREFFRKFISYPGGLIAYASAFLAQFLSIGWAGALVATVQEWLLWLCTITIVRLASGRRILWVGFAGPTLLLVIYARYTYPLIYEHVMYPFDIAMDLLAALVPACLYMATASRTGKMNFVIFVVLASVVYVVAGWIYLLFVAICVLYELLFRRRPATALIFLAAPLAVAYVVSKLFIDVGASGTFNGFLPQLFGGDKLNLVVIYALYLLLPLTLAGSGLMELLRKGGKGVSPVAAKRQNANRTAGQGPLRRLRAWLEVESGAVVAPSLAIVVSLLVVCFCHNAKIKAMMALNYYVSRGMWSKVLEAAGPYQHNKFVNHSINLALYHTGRLGDDMFKYDQVRGALLLSDESMNPLGQLWSFDVLFDIGHMNIAESVLSLSMETFGERPIILRRLALVNMVKGRTGAAKIYLRALMRTLFDAGWAKDYLDKIERDPNLSTDKEIQRLRGMMPEKDRDSQSLDDNLFSRDLLDRNRGNRMAFEYLTAYYLLTGNLDKFAGIIGRIDDFDYKAIPRSYEEAILLYGFLTKKKIELPGREISREATERFNRFNDIYLVQYWGDKNLAFSELQKNFGDSYFFYYLYGRTGIKK